MKFVCDQQLLQNAVAISSRAASSKSSFEELEGILIEAGSTLKLTGYDLKKGIYTTVDADIAEPGSVILNAKLFGEMVRRLPDGNVTVCSDGNYLTTVKCGKTEFSFMGSDPEKYPELPSVDGKQCYGIKQGMLKKMIDQTIFAVSDSDARPVYTGSLFEIDGNTLTVISVDGYRLAVRKETLEGDYGHDEFIVPGTALGDIQRICSGDEDVMINISVGGNHISFTIGDTVVVTRRLEGDFLNYRKAIPASFKYTVTVDKTDLLRTIDRVALIVSDKARNPVRMTFSDGTIDCLCNTPIGKAQDKCFCKGSGNDLEIGFNDRYLTDALKAAPCNELLLCLNSPSSPCVISPADENESFRYMILPIKLRA